ncbi:MAG: hypothetical protein M3O71_30315 [Bacteroidota bacterium]|nr:hypothetical protein [Bacteroidota bacterium]
MQNKSKTAIRIIMIAAGMFLSHVCMDVFKIGVKDGQATLHASTVTKK